MHKLKHTAYRLDAAPPRVAAGGYPAQPYSHVSPQVAGESGSYLYNDRGPDHTNPLTAPNPGGGATSSRFYASMDFRSVTGSAQPGLSVSLSPGAKQGAVRMSYLNISDNGTDGFDPLFYETYDGSSGWRGVTVATGLSYDQTHSLAMDIESVDGVDTSGGQIDGTVTHGQAAVRLVLDRLENLCVRPGLIKTYLLGSVDLAVRRV